MVEPVYPGKLLLTVSPLSLMFIRFCASVRRLPAPTLITGGRRREGRGAVVQLVVEVDEPLFAEEITVLVTKELLVLAGSLRELII